MGAQHLTDPRDTNIVVAGLLADLAVIHANTEREWGYKRAAKTIRILPEPLESYVDPDGTLQKIANIGPASARVIREVLTLGASPTVEQAIDDSGKRAKVDERRAWRHHFVSRALTRQVLADESMPGAGRADYRGDLQMHSTWSDGGQTLEDIFEGRIARGHEYAAITDHSGGLPIANGLSRERFASQHEEIDALNRQYAGRFVMLKGVEANIRADGTVDVDRDDRAAFDIVLAAPHSALRSKVPQTDRMLAAVNEPGIHILAHPRGRMYGSRPGITADWPRVFAAAAAVGVAVEIDGDPHRQDMDYVLARQAADAGCLIALDSDAHGVSDWIYTDIALTHARLAGIPRERVINCWPLEELLAWARRLRDRA